MLMIRRRVGQRLVIGGTIEVTVAGVARGSVRLGVVAPPGVAVLRGEVHDRIVAANRNAAETPTPDEMDALAPRVGEGEDEEEFR
jgi:carbon storage regulator